MQKSDDITALYDQFGGNPDHFREIGRADRTYAARSRWPLFTHLAREQGLEVPPTLDGDTEALSHAPVAQPSRDFQQQAAPQRSAVPAPAREAAPEPEPAPAHEAAPAAAREPVRPFALKPAPEPATVSAQAADTASVWSIRGAPSASPTRPAHAATAHVQPEPAPVSPFARGAQREPAWQQPRAATMPKVNLAAAPQVAPAPAPARARPAAPVFAAAPTAASRLASASPLRRLARPEPSAAPAGDNSRNVAMPAPADDLASVFSRLSDGGYGGERDR